MADKEADGVIDIDLQMPLESERQQMNRDYVYQYKHITRNATPGEKLLKDPKLQRIESFAKLNNISPEELMDHIKDSAPIAERN